MFSIQETLNLQSTLAYAVSLVPVDLRPPKGSVRQPNGSISFEFAPTLPAVSFPQRLQTANAATRSDDFDVRDVFDDLKHRCRSPGCHTAHRRAKRKQIQTEGKRAPRPASNVIRRALEGVLASFAQFDNDVRSERTRAGMCAALELGRWTFPAPRGYLNAPKWSGKSLVPGPKRAPLVKQIFEDFATGRFTKQEVLARVTELGLRTRRGLALSPQSFGQMMRNSIYIGRIESPDYGISTQGDFEPVVDEATFYREPNVLQLEPDRGLAAAKTVSTASVHILHDVSVIQPIMRSIFAI